MEYLFNEVIEYGYYVRKLDETSNKTLMINFGLDCWNMIKNKIVKLNLPFDVKWNEHLDTTNMYNYIHDVLNMKGDESDDTNDPNWKYYHFVLQLIRIPKNNPICNITRACQVAYNIGQYKASIDKYEPHIHKYIKDNNLLDYNTYFS